MGRWFTIKQKRAMVKKASESPAMTQEELAAWAKVTLKLKRAPAQTTVSDILKKDDTILPEDYSDGNRRRPLRVTSSTLEKQLWEWIQTVEAQGVCLSRALIKLKARDIQKDLCDAWEMVFSDGWLTAFERRHGLRSRQRPGEAGSADPVAVAVGRQRLQAITDLYSPQDIYNMDETGLCYAMAPVRSICTKAARGVKKDKTRITLALTANADGTNLLPPLFLGRAKQPYCFQKKSAEELGFYYRANAKAWMNGQVLREWLRGLDRDMRASGRFILLLLDNASSHNTGNLVCTNVQVEFLPPNTTAFLQPMDAGIIAAFKVAYRHKQLEWVYNKIKHGDKIDKKAYKVDQLTAMQWSKAIWLDLRENQTVQNCFHHTGILYNAVDDRSKDSISSSYDDLEDVENLIIRASQISL